MLSLFPMTTSFDPAKRHDFVFLFDATWCNPNGDPDNDNMPRQDLETRGPVTSGALKRNPRLHGGGVW